MSLLKNPHISVVVLAYNAQRTLKACLTSLAKQIKPPQEIIIVYRESMDQTHAIIKKFPHVRLITQNPKHSGISAARNIGVREARGEIVAFTDADCIVPADWTDKIATTFSKNPTLAAVGGPVVGEALQPSWIATYGGYVAQMYGTVGKIATNNCAVKKNTIEKMGGFDERLKTGEDVDFSWRLEQAKVQLIVDQTLVVKHLWRTTFVGFMKEQFAYGRGRGALILRYPDKYPLIERLTLPLFFLIIILCFGILCISLVNRLVALQLFLLLISFGLVVVVGRRWPLSQKIIQTKGMRFFLVCMVVYFLIDMANLCGIVWEYLPNT